MAAQNNIHANLPIIEAIFFILLSLLNDYDRSRGLRTVKPKVSIR
jgi:hypothetical protein